MSTVRRAAAPRNIPATSRQSRTWEMVAPIVGSMTSLSAVGTSMCSDDAATHSGMELPVVTADAALDDSRPGDTPSLSLTSHPTDRPCARVRFLPLGTPPCTNGSLSSQSTVPPTEPRTALEAPLPAQPLARLSLAATPSSSFFTPLCSAAVPAASGSNACEHTVTSGEARLRGSMGEGAVRGRDK